MITLDYKVFPSEEKTIEVEANPIHGDTTCYSVKYCVGLADGNTKYIDEKIVIPFVFKIEGDLTSGGVQSEQLAYILLDRCVKLNKRFPSDHNAKMIAGLDIFLDACKERVEERVTRGVMGELKK